MSSFASIDDYFEAPAPRRRAGALAPLLLGGALAVMALAGRSRFGQSRLGAWLRGFLEAGGCAMRDGRRRRLQDERLTLPQIRGALLGCSKARIAARFGPPRTAVMTAGGDAPGQFAFWRAQTWYYAIDPRVRTAMAVKFDGDVATEVDFFEAPGEREM